MDAMARKISTEDGRAALAAVAAAREAAGGSADGGLALPRAVWIAVEPASSSLRRSLPT